MSGGLANKPVPRQSLPRVEDRWSFLYAERCIVHRAENALTLRDEQGTVHVPAATISSLLLGPAASIAVYALCIRKLLARRVEEARRAGLQLEQSGTSL